MSIRSAVLRKKHGGTRCVIWNQHCPFDAPSFNSCRFTDAHTPTLFTLVGVVQTRTGLYYLMDLSSFAIHIFRSLAMTSWLILLCEREACPFLFFLRILKFFPSNRFSPSSVPIQIKPVSSFKMQRRYFVKGRHESCTFQTAWAWRRQPRNAGQIWWPNVTCY